MRPVPPPSAGFLAASAGMGTGSSTKWVDRKDPTKVDAVQLHDHPTDPQENTNVAKAPARQGIIAGLDKKWQAGWRAGVSEQPRR